MRAIPFLLAAAAATLVACGGNARREADPARVGALPARIVSMTPALTEIAFALGLGDRVVGDTEYCDFPPEAKRLPHVGGYTNPSVEAILALRPDCVLVSPGPGNRDAALALERAGIRVEVLPSETVAEALAAMEEVGRRCGAGARGRELAAAVRARLDAVARRSMATRRPRVLFCVQTDPIVAAGRGTLPSELVEIAGGTNVIEAERYPRVGIEGVLAAAPDVVLQSRMDVAEPEGEAPELAFWKRWTRLPAVAGGRVHLLAPGVALRPGPRMADDAETLARWISGEGPR